MRRIPRLRCWWPGRELSLVGPRSAASDGYGSFDIYVSEQHDGQWGAPRNLGPKVNTAARDYSRGFRRMVSICSGRANADGNNAPSKPADDGRAGTSMRSTLNGWGNIYQIELSAIGLGSKEINYAIAAVTWGSA